MRRGRKSGRSRRGTGLRNRVPANVALSEEIDSDINQHNYSTGHISGDETVPDFEGFHSDSLSEDCGTKIEQSLGSEVEWNSLPDSSDAELVRNENLNPSDVSFETLHEPLLFEAFAPDSSDTDQKSWEAVFGDSNQLAEIEASSLSSLPSDSVDFVPSPTLKFSPQPESEESISLQPLKEGAENISTHSNSQYSSDLISNTYKEPRHHPRGRGRRRGKTKSTRPIKACKREHEDKDQNKNSVTLSPISIPSFNPTVQSITVPPVKRHRYALQFRERPEPFVMDPGYLRDLKYLESLRPKNIKEERDLLAKLNRMYDRLGADNFPHLLYGLRRKLIVRQEQRENGLPVFDLDAIENFLRVNGRVPTAKERLRMEMEATAANSAAS